MILGLIATGVGLFLLYQVLQHYDPQKIAAAIRTASVGTLIQALLFTTGSFAAIAGIEILAIRHTGKHASIGKIVKTATAAIGIGHCIGLFALSSGAIRYRMYRRAKLDAIVVGEVVAFSGSTVALGLAAVGSAALLYRRDTFSSLLAIDTTLITIVGCIGPALVAAYIVLCRFVRKSLNVWGHLLRLPTWKIACAQTVLGSLDLLCVSGALYSSLQPFSKVDYLKVATLYVGADISALIGHVPGGWGVIEYIVSQAVHGSRALAGILLFRTIYYLLPFVVGAVLFLQDELHNHRIFQHWRFFSPLHGGKS